jgi:hypothetical protein
MSAKPQRGDRDIGTGSLSPLWGFRGAVAFRSWGLRPKLHAAAPAGLMGRSGGLPDLLGDGILQVFVVTIEFPRFV